jgi:hypothetical protein
MRLPHAVVDLALCQSRIFSSLDEAFSKSGVGPLICLVLRIHALAGISNARAIPQNREVVSWASPHCIVGPRPLIERRLVGWVKGREYADLNCGTGAFYSGGAPKKDTGLR